MYFFFQQVIEPVLKVHRAYRYIAKQPHCDRYVLCQLNSPEQFTRDKKSNALISGVSSKILKVGSIGAAFFISTETETPFWTLLNVINAAADCDVSIFLKSNTKSLNFIGFFTLCTGGQIPNNRKTI